MCCLNLFYPLQRAQAPALVPEDADPIWSVGAKSILSSGTGMKQRIGTIINGIHKRLGDPRIGPVLLLGALMSFGNIWLRRSQSTHSSPSNDQTQSSRPVSDGRLCFCKHCYWWFSFQSILIVNIFISNRVSTSLFMTGVGIV